MAEDLLADVDIVASNLKKLFTQAKGEQQNKRYSLHSRFGKPEIWQAAAENCIQTGADPYSFIRAAFLYCSVPGGPFAQNMATKAAVRWYEEYRRTYGKDDHSRQDVYENEVKAMILSCFNKARTSGWHKKIKDFLLDDNFSTLDSVPAFVRVILLPHDEDIFRKFGMLAYQDLWGNQHLLETVQKLGYDLTFIERIRK